MVDKYTITERERDLILTLQESHFQDLKAKEIKPGKLSESVSAFANASGGEIFVGIGEDNKGPTPVRSWDGFSDMEEANAHLQMLDGIAPLADFIVPVFLNCEGESGVILKIEILKNAEIVSATNGVIYVRKGAQKLPVDTDDGLQRLKLDKGISSYEDYAVNTDLKDITNSKPIIDFLLQVVPAGEPEPWLKKQKLISKGDKPTVAGVLLFAEEPQAIIPKRSAIKIFRYKTTDLEPSRDQLEADPETIEGSAYELIYDAVERTQQLIQDIYLLGSVEFETVEYPTETLHEIITNAVLHRDYSIATDVQVRIFDNRIEVESPGRLAGHVTPANILATQFARNQRIVRLINKFPNPPNKDVGEGLNTAFAAMRKLRLREPTIEETEASVIVTIPHQKLASPEELVMEHLNRAGTIRNSEARKVCGIVSENSMKSVFKRLEARGMIERVPDLPQSKAAWRKTRV